MNKILLVEDDPRLRSSVAQMLEFEGFLVQAEANGRLGWEAIEGFRPDVVVSDVMMPEMDGLELLETIRAHPATQNIPVILLTAKASRDDTRSGMARGADDYLTKPFEIDELVEAIEAQVQKRSTRLTGLQNLEYTVKTALPNELFSPVHTILSLTSELEEQLHSGKTPPREDLWEVVRNVKDASRRLLRHSQNMVLCRELMERVAHRQPVVGTCTPGEGVFQDELRTTIAELVEEYQRDEDVSVQLEWARLPIPAAHFRKILQELLDNALKFSQAGQPVNIRGRGLPNATYCLTLEDEGPGMDPQEIAQIGIFRQFNRREAQQVGLGLGLAIVQMLAQLYGGRLELVCPARGGLHASVYLPLREAAPAMPDLPQL